MRVSPGMGKKTSRCTAEILVGAQPERVVNWGQLGGVRSTHLSGSNGIPNDEGQGGDRKAFQGRHPTLNTHQSARGEKRHT